MTINEFKKIWQTDPEVEQLIEVESVEHDDGFIDYLFHILFKSRTIDYGRHAGLRVRVDRTLEVISHDIFNMTIDSFGNWVEAVSGWFYTWVSSYSTASNITGSTTSTTTGSSTYYYTA